MSNMQTPTAMVDVQGLADTRRIAINRVGIKSWWQKAGCRNSPSKPRPPQPASPRPA